jgi:hypothetical protein
MAKKCSELRKCEICNNEYLAKVVTARFCSRQCMYVWRGTLPSTKQPRSTKPNVLGIKQCAFCNNPFEVLTNRKTLCSKHCMYEWRKSQSQESAHCRHCGQQFTRYKTINKKTGLPKQYCSNECNRQSTTKREKLRAWGLSDKNHWNNPVTQDKVKQTKLKLYGDANYNNMSQHIKTCNKKYGVPYAILTIATAAGKRISNIQRIVYESIQTQHSDALLEHWLRDAQKSVDIFIPSTNEVIEIYGTYWHCDPRKYDATFYNKSVKMTAQQIWDRDAKRKQFLESLGYSVTVVWEKDVVKSQQMS